MPQGPEIHIEPPKKESASGRYWGTFVYDSHMPWGPWYLISEPRQIFEVDSVAVLECSAQELVEDERGWAAESTLAYDPCSRHFLVGQTTAGKIIWWHNLIQEFDTKNGSFAETSITFADKLVVVRGYGGYGDEKGKAVCIDVKTGIKSISTEEGLD